jgi:hydrogenase expression/formation protein HypC
MAKIQFGGITKQASLEMVPGAKEGDYVLVHVGVAISIVDEEEAKKSFEYLEMIGEIDELIEHTQTDRNDFSPTKETEEPKA